jgi:4-alpha-glucanotransferase
MAHLGIPGMKVFRLGARQDVFGWRDRINRPASVGEQNWTWRLPWPVEDLMSSPESRQSAEFLRRSCARFGRRR